MESFNQTSNIPYDRHQYKLIYTDGKQVFFEHYEDVQATWFRTAQQFLSHVEVLDKKTKKGFK
jgi:hypothetical protein